MDSLDKLQIKIDNYIESCEQSRNTEKKMMYVFSVLFVICFCLVCGNFISLCSKTKTNQTIKERIVREKIYQTDTIINTIVQDRIKIKTKLDTLNKIIYVPRYTIIKDTVLCDSLYSLAIVQKKMISNDSNLIAKLNINIKNYKKLDTLQSKTIDSLQRLPKNSLKWFSFGFGSGVIIGKFVK